MATPVQRHGPREGRGRRQGGGGHQHNRWYQAALPPCACLPCPPGALPLQTCAPPNATEKQRQPPPPPLPAQLSWPAVSAAQLQLTHISVVAQQGPRHTPWGHQRDQTPPGLPLPCHSTAACCLQHCSQQGEGAARAPWVRHTARTYTAHSHSHKTSAHTPRSQQGTRAQPPQTLARKPVEATSKTQAGEEGSGPTPAGQEGARCTGAYPAAQHTCASITRTYTCGAAWQGARQTYTNPPAPAAHPTPSLSPGTQTGWREGSHPPDAT